MKKSIKVKRIEALQEEPTLKIWGNDNYCRIHLLDESLDDNLLYSRWRKEFYFRKKWYKDLFQFIDLLSERDRELILFNLEKIRKLDAI